MTFVITDQCRGVGCARAIARPTRYRGERRQLYVIDPRLCIECAGAAGFARSGRSSTATANRSPISSRALAETGLGVARVHRVQHLRASRPVGVIGMVAAEGKVGHARYPALADAQRCLGCALCAASCPVAAIQMAAPVMMASAVPPRT